MKPIDFESEDHKDICPLCAKIGGLTLKDSHLVDPCWSCESPQSQGYERYTHENYPTENCTLDNLRTCPVAPADLQQAVAWKA